MNDEQETKEAIRPIQVSCLSDPDETLIVRDEDGFASLIGMYGRQGNRKFNWICPATGAHTN